MYGCYQTTRVCSQNFNIYIMRELAYNYMDFLSFHWAVKWPIPVKGLIIAYTLTEELLLLNQHKLDWSKHIATCNM